MICKTQGTMASPILDGGEDCVVGGKDEEADAAKKREHIIIDGQKKLHT